MPLDRCANRLHCLSKPPPIWTDELLPRAGYMPCVERARGECPYRERYGCSDVVKDIGLQIGHCAIEQMRRDELGSRLRSLILWVAEPLRDPMALLVELWLDATLYSERAQSWALIAWEGAVEGEAQYSLGASFQRAESRYRGAATWRLLKRFRQLQPYLDEACARRREAERSAG